MVESNKKWTANSQTGMNVNTVRLMLALRRLLIQPRACEFGSLRSTVTLSLHMSVERRTELRSPDAG